MDLSSFGVDKKEKNIERVDDERLGVDIEKLKEDFSYEEIERYLPWFLKYRVEHFSDLIVTKEIKKILETLENFKAGKALLLVGPPGSGKTTTTELLAKHLGYELFELNASDSRNKKSILESVGDVMRQSSLFAKSKLILIDEVDGVSGNQDRGGVAELSKIVKESKFPIVFTANDKESDKLKPLKKVCTFVDFENHSEEVLLGIARRIFKEEKISFDEKELLAFVQERSQSDIRGFINDLQASSYTGSFDSSDALEIRDYKKKIEMLLNSVFFSYPEDAYKSSFNSEINLDDLFLYLEESMPKVEVDKKALDSMFNEVSKADVYKGRIMKFQYWRYLVYVNFYLSYAVSASKSKPQKVQYKRNERILKKWIYSSKFNSLASRTKMQKNKGEEKRFIEVLAHKLGTSAKRTRSRDIPYYAFMYQNSGEFAENFDKKFFVDESVKKSLNEFK